ncbi:MAG: hypothetical protein ICV62_01650 [Cyanobacteria bacterium Co-bin13]|nr:hypothetical protein [Cyanobacteria bacterium Co-bin13]
MLTVRTMKHVATSRTIPSFRSCRTVSSTPASLIQDQGRMVAGYAQMLVHDSQRQWRDMMWRRH